MPSFSDRLADAIRRCRNPVLVGLDPRWESLPSSMTSSAAGSDDCERRAHAYRDFCNGIVDAVADLVPVVKPQAAFFEELGPAGMVALGAVVKHARQKNLLVILDGKRNDIGSTATAYASGYLGASSAWGADALTVSPYLGDDSLTPFFDVAIERDAAVFVLVKTSNPGGGQFQDLQSDGIPLYRRVADYVEAKSAASAAKCGYGAVGAVVGATYPGQLVELRSAMPHTWFLVPGYGSQGGTAADVAPAFDPQGFGAIVNNSRGINFAYKQKKYAALGEARWQDAARQATLDMIEELRVHTPAGKLR